MNSQELFNLYQEASGSYHQLDTVIMLAAITIVFAIIMIIPLVFRDLFRLDKTQSAAIIVIVCISFIVACTPFIGRYGQYETKIEKYADALQATYGFKIQGDPRSVVENTADNATKIVQMEGTLFTSYENIKKIVVETTVDGKPVVQDYVVYKDGDKIMCGVLKNTNPLDIQVLSPKEEKK